MSGGKVSQDMILSTSMNMLAARKGTGGVKIEIVFYGRECDVTSDEVVLL